MSCTPTRRACQPWFSSVVAGVILALLFFAYSSVFSLQPLLTLMMSARQPLAQPGARAASYAVATSTPPAPADLNDGVLVGRSCVPVPDPANGTRGQLYSLSPTQPLNAGAAEAASSHGAVLQAGATSPHIPEFRQTDAATGTLGAWLAQRMSWLGSEHTCRHVRGGRRNNVWRFPCHLRQLRVLQWRVPLYGQFEQWKAGEPRPVIPSLFRFGEAVKSYLGIELPAGVVPNNTHFFPDVSSLPPEEAFADDRCGIPGLQVAWSEANQLVDAAHVLYVDYPFVMGGERGMQMLPDLHPGQAAVLYFEGESAEHYPWVGSTAFQRYFNATIGSPRGFFDFPATTGYMSKPHQLEGVPSQQLGLVRAAHPRWLQEAALPAPVAESAKTDGVADLQGALLEGEALVAVLISNCGAPSFRLSYVQELMSHIRVDSYGGCLHNRDIPVSLKEQHGQVSKTEYFQGDWRGLKVDLFKRYPFVLAFENANCYDSVTEKVFDPLLAGAVPIYMGAPNIADFVPRHSVIDTRWFSGPAELAAYLRALIFDPQQYASYHAWRNETAADWPWMVDTASGTKLCDVIRLKHAEQCT